MPKKLGLRTMNFLTAVLFVYLVTSPLIGKQADESCGLQCCICMDFDSFIGSFVYHVVVNFSIVIEIVCLLMDLDRLYCSTVVEIKAATRRSAT